MIILDETFNNLDVIKWIKDNDSSLYSKINDLYVFCQYLLDKITNIFPNYTLHDIQHSIRVIGYMNDFVKHNLKDYSIMHLAAIVFVGLLHDTGMYVSDEEKENLYNDFIKKDPKFSDYSAEKKLHHLQNYIRNAHGDRVSKIINYRINKDTTIHSLMYMGQSHTYDISGIIVNVCRSHQKDFEWIEKNIQSNHSCGKYSFNPRHIAFLLRIADALDIDDRRAPPFLYWHINLNKVSNEEWRKHIPIRNYDKVRLNNGQWLICFDGECDDPEIYRKIKEYLDNLEDDIRKIKSASETMDSQYKLNISLPIKESITTKGFIQSELQFTLQYKQVSRLLMGEKIYGEKKDGLRELLQNSIDAVKLMNDIQSSNPYSTYEPVVGIDFDKANNKFIVYDNGIGMTEEILKKYFFNIGNSYYTSDEFLERNHSYNPIGHFGIGFLACFMLSSRAIIETKYYNNDNFIKMNVDKDSQYITILDTIGLDFPLMHGTRILLEYNQVIPFVFETEDAVFDYIKSNILTDNFVFKVINSKRDVIFNKAPKKCMSFEDGLFFYEYKLNSDANVKFNIFDYFEKTNFVYVMDINEKESTLRDFTTLDFIKECIDEIDYNLQSHKIDIANLEMHIDDYYSVLGTIINDNLYDIKKYYINNHSIKGYFNTYFSKIIISNNKRYYRIPYIEKNSVFNDYLQCRKMNSIKYANKYYYNSIKYIYAICPKNCLDDITIINLIEDRLSFNIDDITDPILLDCIKKYPFRPQPVLLDLISLPDSDYFFRVIHDYDDFFYTVYLNGIRIKNGVGVNAFPHIIDGINPSSIRINVVSNQYETDISRDNLIDSFKDRLINRTIRIIYNDLVNNRKFDDSEKKIIEYFLDTYYK